jgi:ABC-2 type transport system permease protein
VTFPDREQAVAYARRLGAGVTDAFADVPRFLRLKLALLGGAFRRSPWQVVGLIIAALYGVGMMVLLVGGLVAARFVPDVASVRAIVIVSGAVVTTGFLLLPLVFGVDDTLDPRKFALFGIRTNRLAVGLAAGSILSVPAIVLAVCALATVVTWSHGFWLALLALIAAVLATATGVLAGRVATAVAAFLLDTRRARELTGVIGVLLVVLISPLVLSLSNVDWGSQGLSIVVVFADILRWSPVGAAWAVPADTAAGHGGAAALELLIALAMLAALWLAWRALVAHMIVTPSRSGDVKTYSGLGWFGVMPATRWGAIAARSLTYWGRDARYWVSLVMIPVIPAIILVAFGVVHAIPGNYPALLPLPIMALFLGWAAHNDVAYDGTAVWLHVVAGKTGLADRIGRLVPVLFIGIPLIVIGTAVSVYFYGDTRVALALVGVSASELFVGLGLSSVTSTLAPYPVPKPGDSPFAQPQSVGAAAAVVQGFSLTVILVLSAPSIVFGVLGVFADPSWFVASLWAGLVVGALGLAGGVLGGAAIFNRRGPQMIDAAVKAA